MAFARPVFDQVYAQNRDPAAAVGNQTFLCSCFEAVVTLVRLTPIICAMNSCCPLQILPVLSSFRGQTRRLHPLLEMRSGIGLTSAPPPAARRAKVVSLSS